MADGAAGVPLPAACRPAERDGAARLAAAVREGTGPPEEGAPPEFLAEEVAAVRESPVRAETEPVP